MNIARHKCRHIRALAKASEPPISGVSLSDLKYKKRLFWRGDVVAMKVQPQSEEFDFIVKSQNADLFDSKNLGIGNRAAPQ
jgi:hypothetical protein